MSNDSFTMTEDELSERQQHSMVAGEHSAYQHIHGILLKEAGDLFANGKDEKANFVRELARKIGAFKEESQKKLQEHINRSMKR